MNGLEALVAAAGPAANLLLAIIALMVIWAIPTVALFLNSVRPGDVASSSGFAAGVIVAASD